MKLTITEIFETKFIIDKCTGCWNWIKCRKKHGLGYGWVSFNGTQIHAHRLSWIIYRGNIKTGFMILHKCDNPVCVNPDHLYEGTQKDNVRDAVLRKRHKVPPPRYGEQHPRSKLKRNQAIRIRTDNRSARLLAKIYNISESRIYAIRNGSAWRE